MLYITWEDRESGFEKKSIWHVNEPVPVIDGYVVTFQADGHELDLILTAMRGGYNYSRATITQALTEPLCANCGDIAESHLMDGTCTVEDHEHQHWEIDYE